VTEVELQLSVSSYFVVFFFAFNHMVKKFHIMYYSVKTE